MRKNFWKAIIVGWFVGLVPLSAFFLLVVEPQMRQRKTLDREIQEKEKLYYYLRSIKQKKEDQKLDLEIAGMREQYNKFLLKGEDLNHVDFQIGELARQKHLQNFSSKNFYNDGADFASYKKINERCLKVSFESEFRQFMDFLISLESYQPVVFINQMTLVKDLEGESTVQPQAEMELSVLYERKS